jgi:hypothetical protein
MDPAFNDVNAGPRFQHFWIQNKPSAETLPVLPNAGSLFFRPVIEIPDSVVNIVRGRDWAFFGATAAFRACDSSDRSTPAFRVCVGKVPCRTQPTIDSMTNRTVRGAWSTLGEAILLGVHVLVRMAEGNE